MNTKIRALIYLHSITIRYYRKTFNKPRRFEWRIYKIRTGIWVHTEQLGDDDDDNNGVVTMVTAIWMA